MGERRTLVDGLNEGPPPFDAGKEREFVYGGKDAPQPSSVAVLRRIPVSTRIRADFADALKRASLERQLKAIEPSTLQDILEEAIEPWLRSNGYLS